MISMMYQDVRLRLDHFFLMELYITHDSFVDHWEDKNPPSGSNKQCNFENVCV